MVKYEELEEQIFNQANKPQNQENILASLENELFPTSAPRIPDSERTVLGEAGFGIQRSYPKFKETYSNVIAAIGALTGIDTLKEYGLKTASELRNEINQTIPTAKVQSIVKSAEEGGVEKVIEDLPYWLANEVSEQTMNIAETLVTAIGGAAIGSVGSPAGSIGGLIAGTAGKGVIKKFAAKKMLELVAENEAKGMARGTAIAVASRAPAKLVFKDLGAKAGIVAGTLPLEWGSTYGELAEKNEGDQFGAAMSLATASPAALLELWNGSARLVGKVLNPSSKVEQVVSRNIFSRFGKNLLGNAAQQMPEEFLQETGQEFLQNVAEKLSNPESVSLTDKKSLLRYLEAGLSGAAVGSAFSVGGATLDTYKSIGKEGVERKNRFASYDKPLDTNALVKESVNDLVERITPKTSAGILLKEKLSKEGIENKKVDDILEDVRNLIASLSPEENKELGQSYAEFLAKEMEAQDKAIEQEKKEAYKKKIEDEVAGEIQAKKEAKLQEYREWWDEEDRLEQEQEVAKKNEELGKRLAEREARFKKGEQGDLILEELDELTPFIEEEIFPETSLPEKSKQIEMLTPKGQVKKSIIKKQEPVLKRVGDVVDKLKGYRTGWSVKNGTTVEGVLQDAIINPVSAFLMAKKLGKEELAQEAKTRAVHIANAIVKVAPEVKVQVNSLLDKMTEGETKPMPVSKVNEQPVVKQEEAIQVKEKGEALKQETFDERVSRIRREAEALGISRKGKTLDKIEEEISVVRKATEEKKAKEQIAESTSKKIPDKKVLLLSLKKLIDNIYTETKKWNEESRKKLFNKYKNESPESLQRIIKNMASQFEVEKKEEKAKEKQAIRESIEEAKSNKTTLYAPEDIAEKDLTGVIGDELTKALTDAAYTQIKTAPVSGINKRQWVSHIKETFQIEESAAASLWDKAFKRFTRELGIEESLLTENFVQDVSSSILKALAPSGWVSPSGVTKGVTKAFMIKNYVSKAASLLDYLDSSPLSKAFADAVSNSPIAMTRLKTTKVNTFLNSDKRSNAKIEARKNDAGEIRYIRTINLHFDDTLMKLFKLSSGVPNFLLEVEVMHEINHILGLTQIQQNPAFKKELRNLINALEATLSPERKTWLEYMRKHDGKAPENTTQPDYAILYGLMNEQEFFATISSDVRLQDYASRVQYKEPKGVYGVIKSVWDKFISLIKLFDYEGKVENSVLDSALRLYAQIIETPLTRTMTESKTIKGDITQAQAAEHIENFFDGVSKLIGDSAYTWRNFKKLIRVPVWNETLEPLVNKVYETDREAHKISFIASRMIKFLKQGDISEELSKAIVDSDAAGTRVGYDKLSVPDKVKFDSIRNALDYIIRDRMKAFYIRDAVYRKEKGLNRKINEDEKTQIVRDADVFIKEHYAARVIGEFESLTKEELLAKVKEAGHAITGKESKEELYILLSEAKEMESMYFPRFRFGDQALVVKDKAGKTLFFGTFDSVREMNKTLNQFFEDMGDVQYESFDMRERFIDSSGVIFAIQNARILENMLKGMGEESQDIKRLANIVGHEFLKKWAGGRFAHRNQSTIAGYSINIVNALHKYIETFPKAMVRKFMAAEIEDAVARLPETEKKYGKNLVDYFTGKILKEGKVNQAIRTVIFNAYFMLKPAFAVVNLTQRLITTIPKAIEQTGSLGDGLKIAREAQIQELDYYKHQFQTMLQTKEFKGLYDAIDTYKKLTYEERMVIKKLVAEGVIAPLRTHEIVESSKIGRAFSFFASLSEKSNRLMSAFAALKIGRLKGLKGQELQDYTMNFVNRTQWLYNKANRAELARGILAPVMMFKSFVLNDLNFMKQLYPNKKAFGVAVAARLSLGGVGGIYGAQALMSVFALVMSSILGNDEWELDKKEFKDKFPRWFTEGLPSLMGVSGSSMFGSSELFGTALSPYAKALYTVGAEYKTLGEVRPETWRKILPSQAKHIWRLNLKERFQDEDIKHLPKEIRKRVMFLWKDTPKEQQTWESFLDIVGFATETPAQFYETINAIKGTANVFQKRKTEYARKIAKALFEKDYERASKLRREAREKGYALSRVSIRRFLRRMRTAR